MKRKLYRKSPLRRANNSLYTKRRERPQMRRPRLMMKTRKIREKKVGYKDTKVGLEMVRMKKKRNSKNQSSHQLMRNTTQDGGEDPKRECS
jgi:hypothetical protein